MIEHDLVVPPFGKTVSARIVANSDGEYDLLTNKGSVTGTQNAVERQNKRVHLLIDAAISAKVLTQWLIVRG